MIITGFTQVDPSTIRQEDLPKSALPNLSPTNKCSYVKRLYETLTKQLCIIFYYNLEYKTSKFIKNKNDFSIFFSLVEPILFSMEENKIYRK